MHCQIIREAVCSFFPAVLTVADVGASWGGEAGRVGSHLACLVADAAGASLDDVERAGLAKVEDRLAGLHPDLLHCSTQLGPLPRRQSRQDRDLWVWIASLGVKSYVQTFLLILMQCFATFASQPSFGI